MNLYFQKFQGWQIFWRFLSSSTQRKDRFQGIFWCRLFNTASSAVPQIPLGIEPRTVATLALAARRSNTRLDFIHTLLDLIHSSTRSHPLIFQLSKFFLRKIKKRFHKVRKLSIYKINDKKNGTLNLFPADGYTKMFENMLLNNPDITGNKILSKASYLQYNSYVSFHRCWRTNLSRQATIFKVCQKKLFF
jgi:hypothetical protein